MYLRGLYIQALLVYSAVSWHIEYIVSLIISGLLCLCVSSWFLGEFSLKQILTWYQSEEIFSSQADSTSCFITSARIWSAIEIGSVQHQIWPLHCIQNADSVKIGYIDAYPRPKSIVKQFFFANRHPKDRFAILVKIGACWCQLDICITFRRSKNPQIGFCFIQIGHLSQNLELFYFSMRGRNSGK